LLKTKTALRIFVVLVLFLGPFASRPVYAWNQTGHAVIAYIAYQKLDASVKTKVNELLRKHPDLANLEKAAGVKYGSKDYFLQIFIQASAWPDEIRGDARFYDGKAGTTAALQGFPSMERHREWHFIEMPLPRDAIRTGPSIPNILTAIPEIRARVGKRDVDVSLSVQAYYLSWLIHLVGDAHQPLHCTTRFTTAHGYPAGDLGGNTFKIIYDGQTTSLHSYWDALFGNSMTLSFIQREADLISKLNSRERVGSLSEKVWVDESVADAENFVYTIGADGKGQAAPKVTDSYNKRAEALANKRVMLAALRLVDILKERFPEKSNGR
jgi:hypothetical protein